MLFFRLSYLIFWIYHHLPCIIQVLNSYPTDTDGFPKFLFPSISKLTYLCVTWKPPKQSDPLQHAGHTSSHSCQLSWPAADLNQKFKWDSRKLHINQKSHFQKKEQIGKRGKMPMTNPYSEIGLIFYSWKSYLNLCLWWYYDLD